MAVEGGKRTGCERDVLVRLERAIERLEEHGDDEEVAVLVALTVRTLLRVAEHDLAALRARAEPLLERAPRRLRGAGAVLRLLRLTRKT